MSFSNRIDTQQDILGICQAFWQDYAGLLLRYASRIWGAVRDKPLGISQEDILQDLKLFTLELLCSQRYIPEAAVGYLLAGLSFYTARRVKYIRFSIDAPDFTNEEGFSTTDLWASPGVCMESQVFARLQLQKIYAQGLREKSVTKRMVYTILADPPEELLDLPEEGTRNLEIGTLRSLAEYFEISPEYLRVLLIEMEAEFNH